MATMLAKLSHARFTQCLQFVGDLERVVRNGTWPDIQLTVPDHAVEPVVASLPHLAMN